MKQAAAFPVLAAVSSMSFCVAVGCELFLQGGSVMTAENAPGSRKLFLTGKEIVRLFRFGRVTVHINVDVQGRE